MRSLTGRNYGTGITRERPDNSGNASRNPQDSQASLNSLAELYGGINPKTVAKWRKRTTVSDARMGPKEPASTVLSPAEEAAIVAFRKYTLLPLDDCLYTLQETIPHLTRSSLRRCLQRHGISHLPDVGDKSEGERKKFKTYPMGYFHVDIAEVRTEEGKLYLFVAIDRTSKSAYVERMARWKPRSLCAILSKPFPTPSIPSSPITASSSRTIRKTGMTGCTSSTASARNTASTIV